MRTYYHVAHTRLWCVEYHVTSCHMVHMQLWRVTFKRDCDIRLHMSMIKISLLFHCVVRIAGMNAMSHRRPWVQTLRRVARAHELPLKRSNKLCKTALPKEHQSPVAPLYVNCAALKNHCPFDSSTFWSASSPQLAPSPYASAQSC